MGKTEVCTRFLHQAGDLLGMGAATVGIDVHPVGLGMEEDEFCAKLTEHGGCRAERGAVGAIDSDLQPMERHSGNACLGDSTVALLGIVDRRDRADRRAFRSDGIDFRSQDELLQTLLDLIRKLVAVGSKKFQAVVGCRIVGGRNDDATVGPEFRDEAGDRGRRNNSGQQGVGTCGIQPCDES